MTDPDGQGPTGQGPGDAQPTGSPEPRPETDIDTAFAAIIAGFSTSLPRGSEPWPASEDLYDDSGRDPNGSGRDPDGSGRDPDSGDTDRTGKRDSSSGENEREPRRDGRRRIVLPDDAATPSDHDGAGSVASGSGRGNGRPIDDEDDRYVPPVPPPLPHGDLLFRIAWAGVLGGPLFLIFAALIWQTLPSTLLFLALLAFIGGFVTLVARMPTERPDDPDDGAVV